MMQVRRKFCESKRSFIVLEESPGYYIIQHGVALPKELYEPVPDHLVHRDSDYCAICGKQVST